MYERFANLCKAKGVTAYAVAKATGVRQQVFSDWKHGHGTPKYERLKKIADFFGVSVDYFYT